MKSLFLFVMVLAMSGCATYQAVDYRPSAVGVSEIKHAHGTYAVGEFTSSMSNPKELSCRGGASFTAPKGQSFPQYIQNALTNELKIADAYSASGNPIKVYIEKIDFDSFAGKWFLIGTADINGKRVPISIEHSFSAGAFDQNSCTNAANSFPDAVSEFLSKIYQKL